MSYGDSFQEVYQRRFMLFGRFRRLFENSVYIGPKDGFVRVEVVQGLVEPRFELRHRPSTIKGRIW